MKPNYTLLSVLCLAAAIPLTILLVNRRSAQEPLRVVRFATFNASLVRERPGQLLEELRAGSTKAREVAEIVQRNEVDVLLLCELDRDEAAETARLFRDQYLGKPQDAAAKPIRFEFVFCEPSNTGEPSGLDLDGDGEKNGGPGDAHGFGSFPGQYAMALFSRHPILTDRARTFRTLPWSAMPDALRPETFDDEEWAAVRLSSKSHWDVPIGLPDGLVVHALCSHPTPPVFDGPEDRNGRRNHDEVRFWVDYVTPGRDGWIVDEAGVAGGLAASEPFVVLGDLNCDPVDGDARREALAALLAHPRVADPRPASAGGPSAALTQRRANLSHRGDARHDTADFDDEKGPGNLRVDYVLPSKELPVVRSGIYWPSFEQQGLHVLVQVSDHRLVWVEVALPQ